MYTAKKRKPFRSFRPRKGCRPADFRNFRNLPKWAVFVDPADTGRGLWVKNPDQTIQRVIRQQQNPVLFQYDCAVPKTPCWPEDYLVEVIVVLPEQPPASG